MVNFTQSQQEILLQIQNAVAKPHLPFLKTKRSFYIYGGTGCGKTTIIEKFAMESKKPVLFMHFHDYLLDITRLSTKTTLPKIAKLIAKKFKILCFDEFFIESIADAKILYDIFSYLIKNKVSIIITSNFKPEDLYKNGFNRDLVFPMFSNFLNNKMFVIPVQTNVDFRLSNANTFKQISFKTVNCFQEANNVKIIFQEKELTVDLNHKIKTIGNFENGVVIDYLIFQKHSSIKDYRHLARNFEHVHIVNMKSFCFENEDEAIRFRNFIDILYMRSTIFTYSGNENPLFENELLENIKFKRCNSRLLQMASVEYQTSQHISFKRKANIEAFAFFHNLEM